MKIQLDQNEVNALEQLAGSGMNAYGVLKKIFKHYISDLESVRNIDPKGNMGLQTLARQEALKTVEEIAELLFPDAAVARSRTQPPTGPQGKPLSQYR